MIDQIIMILMFRSIQLTMNAMEAKNAIQLTTNAMEAKNPGAVKEWTPR